MKGIKEINEGVPWPRIKVVENIPFCDEENVTINKIL